MAKIANRDTLSSLTNNKIPDENTKETKKRGLDLAQSSYSGFNSRDFSNATERKPDNETEMSSKLEILSKLVDETNKAEKICSVDEIFIIFGNFWEYSNNENDASNVNVSNISEVLLKNLNWFKRYLSCIPFHLLKKFDTLIDEEEKIEEINHFVMVIESIIKSKEFNKCHDSFEFLIADINEALKSFNKKRIELIKFSKEDI